MIQKIFIDTNIVIDFLAHREEFMPAANILQLGIEGKADLFMTGLTIANITYILRSQLGKDRVKDALHTLCGFIHVAPITETETDKAFNTENPDLEDAIQYFSAKAIEADVIITRDPKHFLYSDIPVMSGKEFFTRL